MTKHNWELNSGPLRCSEKTIPTRQKSPSCTSLIKLTTIVIYCPYFVAAIVTVTLSDSHHDNHKNLQHSNDPPAGAEGGDGCNTVAQHLLLDFLADRFQQRDQALFNSARSFLTCRLFADELTGLRSAGSTPSGDQQLQMLRRYHTLAEQLDKGLKCTINAGKIAQHHVAVTGMFLFQPAQ